MQLFYAPDITPPVYTLCEEESKHCIKVLRLAVGDTLHVTDGKGNLYLCLITIADARRCSIEVVETHEEFEKMPYQLTMAVAPTKNIERFEWFLEKSTEERVITSAVKQSLKAYHPTLDELTPLRKLIAADFEGQKFIAHCDSSFDEKGFKREYLPAIIKKNENILILIGPEGDFSPGEINFALENGFQPITLGEQRLRTETAAVVATVMCAVCNTL